jgi:SAM-dependent methyltransferase
VKQKGSAFREFARVLRPGGRISLFEPINRFSVRDANTWGGYDLSPVAEIAAKVRAIYTRIQPRDTDPMLDFDERDLVRLAEEAGFFPVNLTLEAVIEPVPQRRWQGFLDSAGNPNIPTLREAMEQTLTAEESDRLTAHLRPFVEQGEGRWRMATAYLDARKPDAH